MKKIILILSIILVFTIFTDTRNPSKENIKASTEIEENDQDIDNIQTRLDIPKSKFIELKNDAYYVMSKEDNTILLVNTEKKDFSSTGGINEFYDAISLTDVQNDIKMGQQVQFEIDGVIAESYPGQAKAKNVSIVSIPKPETSNFTVEEVINRALSSKEVTKASILVIKSIKYYEKPKVWQIDLKETIGKKEFTIIIHDY